MKRNRVFRLLASLTVVVLCMTAFSVTAFAGGGDGDYYTGRFARPSSRAFGQSARRMFFLLLRRRRAHGAGDRRSGFH